MLAAVFERVQLSKGWNEGRKAVQRRAYRVLNQTRVVARLRGKSRALIDIARSSCCGLRT
jgi:hypothetical protein